MIEIPTQIKERASHRLRPLSVRDLGLIPYGEAWELQKGIAKQVAVGTAVETLLLLEHPHTFTCGRRGGRANILLDESELDRKGIEVLDVDRGGDVTYHGPGQLVAYPIINLHNYGPGIDYPAYVRKLEDVLIGTLAQFGITGVRIRGFSGVWTESGVQLDKIAAIGVKVDAVGISTHGIALNVNTDLSYFEGIIPCGISGKGVTSMRRVLEANVALGEVKQSFAQSFLEVFSFTPQ